MRKLLSYIVIAVLVSSCGIYSFSGTSIQPDVKTITIPYVEYTALRVNPSLSNDLTEALKEKYRKLTRLEEVDVDGDLELVCTVTGYDVKATAVTANEMASQNRLTVTRKTTFQTITPPTKTLTPRCPLTPWSPVSAKPS